MVRHAADYRTLLWTFVLTPGLLAFLYVRPDLTTYLWPLSCYFALACGVIAHNHNHSPTFKSKGANNFFGTWISIFYGYPTFAWIPTHNLNHHKLVNKAGDATITWRFTNRHNFLVAVTYFFVSSYYQSDPIKTFIAKAKEKNPALYRRIISQYVIVYGTHSLLLALAIFLHGWGGGLKLWLLAAGIPGFFALWTIMLFNYEQHVHADPFSRHNHSRTFEGKLLNFLLFNNGLHTAHHENAGTHWSKLPEVHAQLREHIDPRLLHRSVWWYWFQQYFLAVFIRSLGTEQVGRPGFEPPEGEVDVTADEVELGEAGTNAAMV